MSILKEYVVCEKNIDNVVSYYIIRANANCGYPPSRILADFDTFKEACEYIKYLENSLKNE